MHGTPTLEVSLRDRTTGPLHSLLALFTWAAVVLSVLVAPTATMAAQAAGSAPVAVEAPTEGPFIEDALTALVADLAIVESEPVEDSDPETGDPEDVEADAASSVVAPPRRAVARSAASEPVHGDAPPARRCRLSLGARAPPAARA